MKTTRTTKTSKKDLSGGIHIDLAAAAKAAPKAGESFLASFGGKTAKAAPTATAAKPESWWSDAGEGQLCY